MVAHWTILNTWPGGTCLRLSVTCCAEAAIHLGHQQIIPRREKIKILVSLLRGSNAFQIGTPIVIE